MNVVPCRIAIDGPSGSGKSTIGKRLASHLGFIYVDTGAMYRAVALRAKQAGVSWNDENALVTLASQLKIAFTGTLPHQRILLDGEDVEDAIRTPDMAQGASRVSAISGVRQAMVKLQREMSLRQSVVMDGRDIGTVVFPDAEYKFYLDASAEVRGKRRWLEDQSRGISSELHQTILDVQERDARDMSRSDSPLCCASDAIRIDTSHMDVDAVFQLLLETLRPQ